MFPGQCLLSAGGVGFDVGGHVHEKRGRHLGMSGLHLHLCLRHTFALWLLDEKPQGMQL